MSLDALCLEKNVKKWTVIHKCSPKNMFVSLKGLAVPFGFAWFLPFLKHGYFFKPYTGEQLMQINMHVSLKT